MSWRNHETVPFEPEDRADQELERYAQQVRPVPPPDFIDRVMGAVEQAPPPRRGLLGGLLALPAGWHRPLQAVAMMVVLVAGVAGALAAGELLISFRNVGTSPPSVAPTTTVPSPTPSFSPSPTAEPSGTDTPKPSPSESSKPTERETPEPSETERPETPHPSETPEATDDNSGPGGGGGGGDDNTGPGGGGGGGGLDDDGSHR